jgi:hypothetical protein
MAARVRGVPCNGKDEYLKYSAMMGVNDKLNEYRYSKKYHYLVTKAYALSVIREMPYFGRRVPLQDRREYDKWFWSFWPIPADKALLYLRAMRGEGRLVGDRANAVTWKVEA